MKSDCYSGIAYPGTQRNLCLTFHKVLLIVALLVVGPSVVTAADFQLDSGDSFNLGAGTLDLNCGNFTLQSGAAFNAGSGSIQLAGNWTNQGTFGRGSSSVNFNDNCGAATTSLVMGETHFHNLTASTTAAHELRLQSGRTQTVANTLVLTGAENELLKIRSSVPLSMTYLVLEQGGSQIISHVDVQDNFATVPGQRLAPNTPAYFNSVDSGRNLRWFLRVRGLEVVPTLPRTGLVLLLLVLPVAVYLKRRGRLGRS